MSGAAGELKAVSGNRFRSGGQSSDEIWIANDRWGLLNEQPLQTQLPFRSNLVGPLAKPGDRCGTHRFFLMTHIDRMGHSTGDNVADVRTDVQLPDCRDQAREPATGILGPQ